MIVPYSAGQRRAVASAGLVAGGALTSLGRGLPSYAYQGAQYIAKKAYQAGRSYYNSRPTAPVMMAVPTTRKALKSIKTIAKSKKNKTVKSRLARLERTVADESSTLVYKSDLKDTLKPSAAQALNGFQNFVSTATIESALANCRFFDPATPGTLITANLSTPTFTQKIKVYQSGIATIKNNYQVPCVVTYGVKMPKVATNISPTTAWTNGLTDAGNPTNTSYLLDLKDSSEFGKAYKGKMYTKTLKPGQSVTIKHYTKSFDYDPSWSDTFTETYQPRNKHAMLFYRVRGVLGHDTSVATEQGLMPCGVDVHLRTTYNICYNSGGAAVRTIVLSQGASSSFTNGAVVSQLFTDNQAYSVS